ncbi:MAG: putative sulfate exporter family transporter, partial [Deinococcus sp.]|nr:putative sulfate exporter family transporter [Deinococcus sp.]
LLGIGWAGLIADTVMLSGTFFLTYLLGTRLFRLDAQTAALIGAGSSVCGAAAVLATQPVVRGRADQVTVAVATVVLYGTLGIVLYPQMAALGVWPFTGTAYG